MQHNFTERVLRIIKGAEREVEITNSTVLTPMHLLIACLQERTGALGEIALKCEIDLNMLRASVLEKTNLKLGENPIFNVPISFEVQKTLETAAAYMNRYKQIYLNEGHLLKALISVEEIDRLITAENKKIILTLGTTSRDMITHLRGYSFPNVGSPLIQKVREEDFDKLVSFVEGNFSSEWANTIKDGFLIDEPTIYVAFGIEGDIIGFSAFDVYQGKKGYFGPMGVLMSDRTKGIGYALLHYCLKEMKEIGYEYAIIGGAGPIEFYEKACNAIVIPAMTVV